MLEISISQPASHEFAISNEYYLFVLKVKRNVLRFDFPFFFNLFFFLAFLRTLRSTCEARPSLENISRKRAVHRASSTYVPATTSTHIKPYTCACRRVRKNNFCCFSKKISNIKRTVHIGLDHLIE